jgi:hypothetical protein
MCDYSLELYRSVPAAVGESYKLVRFGTGSMGFAAGTSCDTAACVPTGAHLRLEGIDEALQQTLGIGASEEVVMTRLEGGLHKDAVRFANGREISLQSLNPGLSATMFLPLPDLGLGKLDRVADEIAERDLIDA